VRITRALADEQFDCVFLDYLLPGTDGMEILRKLRESNNSVPVIMLTGHGDERLVVELMRAGASDYVRKDEISAETLARSLVAAIRLHQVELDKRRAEEELFKSNDKISDILESISDAFFAIDNDGCFTYVNTPAEALLERSRKELIGNCIWGDLVPSTMRLRDHLKATMAERAASDFEWQHSARGTWFDAHLYPHADGVSAYLRDITARKSAEAQLIHQASHDALTGLPNRALLIDRIGQALTRAPWHDRFVAVLFCDLDRFKVINDSLGHAVGDELLKMLARRLEHGARGGDTVARLGGDEFVVVLTDMANEQDIEQVAQKLLGTLTQPYSIDGKELVVTTSIGISVYPNDGRDEATLVKHADAAMYQAKEKGRNNFAFYAPTMSHDARDLLNLESDLRKAIARDEFRLFYQPLVSATTGQIVGTEALLRWEHPQRGMVAPDEFLKIAEENGLIVPIGEWVLHEACSRNKAWQRQGLASIPIAVNLSHRQFSQDNLVDHICLTLREVGLAPEFLELELTETIVMDRVEHSIRPLHALRELGVRLAIDDFGTGYSSLAYLKRFPLDVLKIDRSFIADITTDTNVLAIVGAIAAMAKKMNLSVIAEGVETQEQLDCLVEQGCDHMQGFFVSRPLAVDAYEQFLRDWQDRPLSSIPHLPAPPSDQLRSDEITQHASTQTAHYS
jgi:diguanylate cyclase (GGDEF)-like protein/PAS domain S-box-containing protein